MHKLGIFSKLKVGSLNIDNRIVISPMCQYSATNGNATDWHLSHYLHFLQSFCIKYCNTRALVLEELHSVCWIGIHFYIAKSRCHDLVINTTVVSIE